MPHWETLDVAHDESIANAKKNRFRNNAPGRKYRIVKVKGYLGTIWHIQYYDRQSRLNKHGHYIGTTKKRGY